MIFQINKEAVLGLTMLLTVQKLVLLLFLGCSILRLSVECAFLLINTLRNSKRIPDFGDHLRVYLCCLIAAIPYPGRHSSGDISVPFLEFQQEDLVRLHPKGVPNYRQLCLHFPYNHQVFFMLMVQAHTRSSSMSRSSRGRNTSFE